MTMKYMRSETSEAMYLTFAGMFILEQAVLT